VFPPKERLDWQTLLHMDKGAHTKPLEGRVLPEVKRDCCDGVAGAGHE
jgi:hypothetical protein